MQYPLLTKKFLDRIDPESYPADDKARCMYCGGSVGHAEEVWTGNHEGNCSGWELWFCCHACRDRGEPCETFFPIRLKDRA